MARLTKSAPIKRGTKVTKAYKGKTVIQQGPSPFTGKGKKKTVGVPISENPRMKRKKGQRPLKSLYK